MCERTDVCRIYLKCGGHCDKDPFECERDHLVHECKHDFTSGQEVEVEGWGKSATCACGLTALEHAAFPVSEHEYGYS